jgi:catechol 2,3-dioxygenase-like lactoylglutathione lyase family enzyme
MPRKQRQVDFRRPSAAAPFKAPQARSPENQFPVSQGAPMTSETKNDLQFVQVKAISLAVKDAERAVRFYKETLGLPPENIRQMDMAFMINNVILLLKPEEGWYGKPSDELNPRITLEVKDSYVTEKALRQRGVTISDPVAVYDGNPIGAFLDSEGNKLWFCSEAKKG